MGYAVEDGWWIRDGRRARFKDTGIAYSVELDSGESIETVEAVTHSDAMATVTRFLQPRCVVRVTLENGNSWVTTINTDFAGAVDYFRSAGGFEQADGDVISVTEVDDV